MAAQMSEMNDEVAVRKFSSHGVVGGVDDPEFRTLGVSWTLIVIGPSWLHFSHGSSVATAGGKKINFAVLCSRSFWSNRTSDVSSAAAAAKQCSLNIQ